MKLDLLANQILAVNYSIENKIVKINWKKTLELREGNKARMENQILDPNFLRQVNFLNQSWLWAKTMKCSSWCLIICQTNLNEFTRKHGW